MKPKTKTEIKQEIKNLKQLRKTIDISWCPTIAAQILVLEKDLSYDEIHSKYGQFGQDEAVLYLALFARSWIDGRMNLSATLRNISAYRDAVRAEVDYGLEDDEDENKY